MIPGFIIFSPRITVLVELLERIHLFCKLQKSGFMLLEDALCDFSEALILCGLVRQIIIFNYDHVDLSAVGGAGIQCDDAGTIYGLKSASGPNSEPFPSYLL